MSDRNRATFQTALSRAAVTVTIADRHEQRRRVIDSLERLAKREPNDRFASNLDTLVAAVLWAAAEDPDVIEAIRNLGSVFALEQPLAIAEPRR